MLRNRQSLGFAALAMISLAVVLPKDVTGQGAPDVPPDWFQMTARGVDAAFSHGGHSWFVGADGRAYRWQEDGSLWVPHGNRTDLARIDAAADGSAAALTDNGRLYVTAGRPRDAWRPTGLRAADLGIGGGVIWLADAQLQGGTRSVLTATFSATDEMSWRSIPGRLTRIDVDPKGRAWGLDAQGLLYVHTGSAWVRDAKAPPASDIGVGADGTIYAVARDAVEALGGGTVHRRDASGGTWSKLAGRLASVSVSPDGRPFGVNSLSWVLSGVHQPAGTAVAAQPETEAPEAETATGVLLVDLLEPDFPLPETLEDAPITLPEGVDPDTVDLLLGTTTLNGLPTQVAIFTPDGAGGSTLAIGHKALSLGDYVLDAQGTAFEAIGRLSDALFFIVPEDNEGLAPKAPELAALERHLGRDDIGDLAFDAGVTLLATGALSDLPEGALLAAALGLGTTDVTLTAPIDVAVFTDVTPRRTSGEPELALAERTLEALQDKYGEALITGTTLTAPAGDLIGRRLGPARLDDALWEFSLGEALEIALTLDLTLSIAPPTGAAPGVAPEIALSDVRAVIDPLSRSAILEGDVDPKQAESLIALEGFALNSGSFEGELALAEDVTAEPKLEDFETLELSIEGNGVVPSKDRGSAAVDLTIMLALNDDGDALVPTLIIEGDLTLADVLGPGIPGADQVALTRVEASPDHIGGWAELAGSPVHAVRYEPAGAPAPIVGLEHQALDLGTYIPAIRGTSLGSFGLANAVLFILPEDASESPRYETLDDLPQPLGDLLDTGLPESKLAALFPLELKPGVTVIGLYGTADDGGNAAAMLAAFGIDDEEGYVVKGHFKASQIKNARFQRISSPLIEGLSVSASGVASARPSTCDVLAVADTLDKSGLDLGFEIAGFQPPYVGDVLSFENSRFALKEADGQIEPSIITGMTLSLPEKQAGLAELGMAGKLFVRGNLDVFCDGVTADDDVTVAFAGSTALNLDQVADVSFAALEKVTAEEEEAEPEEAEEGEGTTTEEDGGEEESVDEDEVDLARGRDSESPPPAPLGWTPAFGLPFLEIRQFASSGTFSQADGDQSLVSQVWAESKLGSEVLNLFGSVTLEPNDEGATEVTDWLFKAPGPILLAGLPGVDKVPLRLPGQPAGAAAAIELELNLGDLTVSEVELTPDEMSGEIASVARQFEGSILYLRNESEAEDDPASFDIFAGVNRFALNMLLKQPLPGPLGSLMLGDTVLGLRTSDNETLAIGDLPEAAQDMFLQAIGDVFDADSEITLLHGVTLAGRVTPEEMPSSMPGRDVLLAMLEEFDLGKTIVATGGLGPKEDGSLAGALAALVPEMKLLGIPSDTLAFRNNRIELATLEGRSIEVESDIEVQLSAPGVGDVLPNTMAGSLTLDVAENGDRKVTAAASTEDSWTEPFGIPSLTLANVGLEAVSERTGSDRASSIAITADATFFDQHAAARVLLGSSAGEKERLIELTGYQEEGYLQLAAFVPGLAKDAFPMLHGADGVVAKQLLVSTNATAGDFEWTINGQTLTGRGAVVRGGARQALFLRSDQTVGLDTFLPSDVPGPFRNLKLPEGLVIIAPQESEDFDVSDLPSAIFDMIFDDLVEQGPAADVFVSDGVTVMARMDAGEFPAAIGDILGGVFGISREFVIAGGIGGLGEANPSVSFFTQIEGLSLNLPSFVGEVIEVQDSDVALFFRRGGGSQVEVGLSADATLRLPNLNDPRNRPPVRSELSLFMATGSDPSQAGSINVAAKVLQPWPEPLGLEKFGLAEGTAVGIGAAADGSYKVRVRSDALTFQGNSGTDVFRIDLDTAWQPPAVPRQLAIQFAGTRIGPAIYLEMMQSMFSTMAKGAGGGLAEAFEANLRAAGAGGNEVTVAKDFVNQMARGGDILTQVPLDKSPLGLFEIAQPRVFFGTPGNSLQPFEANDEPGSPTAGLTIETPPFGFGLHLEGALSLQLMGLSADVADGVAKINLRDGIAIDGKVRAPGGLGNMDLAMGIPLLNPTAGSLSLSGDVKAPVVGGLASASMDLSRQPDHVYMSGNFSLAKVANRGIEFWVYGDRVRAKSPASCLLPVEVSGMLNRGEIQSGNVAGLVKPQPPDPKALLDCGELLWEGIKKAGEAVAKGMEETGKGIATGAKAVGGATKKAGETVGKGAQQAARAAAQVLNDGVRTLAAGAGAAAEAVRNVARDIVRTLDVTKNVPIPGLADTVGVVTGAVGSLANDIGCSMGLGGCSSEPERLTPMDPGRCRYEYYWNAAFKHCFHSEALVVIRSGYGLQNKLCLSAPPELNAAKFRDSRLGLTECGGFYHQQFVYRPDSGELKASQVVFDPRRPPGANHFSRPRLCVTERNGAVQLEGCTDAPVQKWTYTEAGDFKNDHSGLCIGGAAGQTQQMMDCAAVAAQSTDKSQKNWLATSLFPDYHADYGLYYRGGFVSTSSPGQCLHYQKGRSRVALSPCPAQLEYGDHFSFRLSFINDRRFLIVLPDPPHHAPNLCLRQRPGQGTDLAACDFADEDQYWTVRHLNNGYAQLWHKPMREVFAEEFAIAHLKSGNCLAPGFTDASSLIARACVPGRFHRFTYALNADGLRKRNYQIAKKEYDRQLAAYENTKAAQEAEIAVFLEDWNAQPDVIDDRKMQARVFFPHSKSCMRARYTGYAGWYGGESTFFELYGWDCKGDWEEWLEEHRENMLTGKVIYIREGPNNLHENLKKVLRPSFVPSRFFWLHESEVQGFVRLVSGMGGACVAIPFGQTAVRSTLGLEPCIESLPGQLWRKIQVGKDAPWQFVLMSALTGRCIEVVPFEGARRTSIVQADCGNENQIMTMIWPSFETPEGPPPLAPSDQRVPYAFRGNDTLRCVEMPADQPARFRAVEFADCRRDVVPGKVDTAPRYVVYPTSMGADRWQFELGAAGSNQCIVTAEAVEGPLPPGKENNYELSQSPGLGLGSCDAPDSVWLVEPADYRRDGRVTIREASGAGRCWRDFPTSAFSSRSYKWRYITLEPCATDPKGLVTMSFFPVQQGLRDPLGKSTLERTDLGPPANDRSTGGAPNTAVE